MREERVADPARRSADARVTLGERVGPRGREMGDDDEEIEQRGCEPEREDRRADEPPTVRDRVPDAETADGERDLLLGGSREQRRDPERYEAVVVEEPDSEQDQRHREADCMWPRA